jgi:hypothetical protein
MIQRLTGADRGARHLKKLDLMKFRTSSGV